MNIFAAGKLEFNITYIIYVFPYKVRLINFPEKIFGLRSRVSNAMSPFFGPIKPGHYHIHPSRVRP